MSRQTDEKKLAVGRRINQARLAKNWSQYDLARAVHRTSSAVTQWEKGLTISSRLDKVAEALDVSYEWLRTGKEPEKTFSPENPREARILETLRSLPPSKQDELETELDLLRIIKRIPAEKRPDAIRILTALIPSDQN